MIAQQVEGVYPQAVKTHTGYIPNIYTVAEKSEYSSNSGKLKIYTVADHQLKNGDHVQWIDETGARHYSEVTEASNKKTFTVSADKQPEKVFIYGKEVDDFRMVDYDALSMLNLSATQELSKRLEAMEKENNLLKKENESLKATMNGKPNISDINKLKAQVDVLQQLMEKNGIRTEK